MAGRLIQAHVLFAFVRKYHLKIPYYFHACYHDMLFAVSGKIHELPPLKDVTGMGWINKIVRATRKARSDYECKHIAWVTLKINRTESIKIK